jgi:cytochrome c oxidase cbb3-type subunit 1
MSTDSNEVSSIDSNARGPLLLLLGSGLIWLVVSGVLGLIASVQLHTPGFLSSCAWFTYGHTQALQETSFVYGWLANAGLALGFWVLARLGGESLRAVNWITVGALFWNLGVTLSLVGIMVGDSMGHAFFQIPRYAQPLLLVAFGAIAVSGVLAYSGRRSETTFASQWYVFAALFLFPWIFSVAQVTLSWVPVHGVLQAVAAGWFAQGAFTLWLAPLALAVAYYVVAKVTGRVLPAYQFASLGFWTLIVVGSWTGGRHLIGGPVPAWISSLAIVSCSLLVFHYIVVLLNLRGSIGGGGSVLNLTAFGLLAYVIGGCADAFTSIRSFSVITQFTFFIQAQQQLALYGALSMLLFGALYFAVPRLTGKAWASGALVRGHAFLAMAGVLLLVISLGAAGWTQGHALLNAEMKFADIAVATRPWLLAATVAQALLLMGNLILVVNFLQTLVTRSVAPTTALFRAPTEMEASAS